MGKRTLLAAVATTVLVAGLVGISAGEAGAAPSAPDNPPAQPVPNFVGCTYFPLGGSGPPTCAWWGPHGHVVVRDITMLLDYYGYTVGEISCAAQQTVMGQDPAPGTLASPGTAVNLTCDSW